MSCMIDGSPSAKVLVVGMAPGNTEIRGGKPFTGPSGNLLWRVLKEANIDRSEAYIINTIGELPEGADGEPTDAQLDKYWDAFDQAALQFTGTVALVLGRTALRRYTGLLGIESWRGYLVRPGETQPVWRSSEITTFYKTNTKKHKKGDPRLVRQKVQLPPPISATIQTIVPSLHPAAILKTGFRTIPAFNTDVKRAGRAAQNTLKPSRVNYDVLPFYLPGDVAFDIETGMVNTDLITRIGFANKDRAWTSHWDNHTSGVSSAILSDSRTTKIAHNIQFDLPRLEAAGIKINGPIYDTMLAANLLQPDLYKGLNSVIPLFLDTERHKHLAETDEVRYNALDAIREYELFEATQSALHETGQYNLFMEEVMATVPTLIRMSRKGIKLHQKRQLDWVDQLRADLINKETHWNLLTGCIRWGSTQQVNKYFQSLNIPLMFNKYGGATTEESALREYMVSGKAPLTHIQLIELLLELRALKKMLGTYAQALSGTSIHPSYLPSSKDDDSFGKGMAGTGRITAKDPNVQNQPPAARLLVIPWSPTSVLVELDYSQIEARIMAALGGDEALQAAIDAGLHNYNMQMLGVDKTRAKNGFYGWAYGAGPRTLQRTFIGAGYNISYQDCKQLLLQFNQIFSKTAAWRQAVVSAMAASRYVANPFGRRRYFYAGLGDATAAMDFLPQSTAASIMWRILPGVEKTATSFGGHLLATIHDSVLVELPLATLREGAAAIREEMEREWPQISPGFKVPVAMKTGPSWGEMSEYVP